MECAYMHAHISDQSVFAYIAQTIHSYYSSLLALPETERRSGGAWGGGFNPIPCVDVVALHTYTTYHSIPTQPSLQGERAPLKQCFSPGQGGSQTASERDSDGIIKVVSLSHQTKRHPPREARAPQTARKMDKPNKLGCISSHLIR